MDTLEREPLRLLILTDTAILGPGGSERFLRNLVAHLPRTRYSIDVLQLAAPPRERVGTLDDGAARLMYRPIDAIYAPRGLAAFWFVLRRALRGNYSILQSQHEKSDLITAFLPRFIRARRISNRRDMGFQKTGRLRALFRRANARFDRIVAPSRAILDALVAEENADGRRCTAIPNGVDTQRFRPVDAAARTVLRDALGFDDAACVIGCVASFTPVKCHTVLVEAFAALHARHPGVQLVLVGEGPLRGAIEAQIAALGLAGSVHLLGARADIERILPALDVFVLASSTEGLSNAILEAQSCGLPVVATDVGGNGELVREGIDGRRVPPNDVAALAGALAELVADGQRRSAFGTAARERVEREFSIAAMVAAYEKLYGELAYVR